MAHARKSWLVGIRPEELLLSFSIVFTYVVNLLNFNVSFSRQSDVFRLGIDNDEHWVRAESLQLLVDSDVVLKKFKIIIT